MRFRSMVLGFALVSASISSTVAQSLAGEWDATVKANGVDVPCRFNSAPAGGNDVAPYKSINAGNTDRA